MSSLNGLLLLALTAVSGLALRGTSGRWDLIGPGGGGALFLPKVNPNDSTHVILRSDMTGTFISDNSGESWEMMDFLAPANDFAFDPSAPDDLYAASAELLHSQDRGKTWRMIFPRPEEVERFEFWGDHADPSVVLRDGTRPAAVAAVRPESSLSGSLLIGLEDGSLLLTNDYGETWTRLETELNGTCLSIFPGSWWERPGEWIALSATELLHLDAQGGLLRRSLMPLDAIRACQGGCGEDGVVLYAASGTQVFRSLDLGKSWQQVDGSKAFYSGIGFQTLSVSEYHPEVVFIGVDTTPFGIINSIDSGDNWDWVYRVDRDEAGKGGFEITTNNYSGAWLDQSYGPGWREYPFGLGVSPSDPDICYATDSGSVYLTTDGGKNWRQRYTEVLGDGRYASRGANITNCQEIEFDPFDRSHILTGYHDIGIFSSRDGGESWSHAVDGILRPLHVGCYSILFDPDVRGRVWSAWGSRHDLPRSKMFRDGTLLERAYGAIAYSESGGDQWETLVERGIPSKSVCTHIILDPASPIDSRVLYVSAFQGGIYKSEDSGRSWRVLPRPPTGRNLNFWRLALSANGDLYSLVVRDRRGTRWEAQEFPGGLFRSRDGGESWEVVTLPRGYDYPNDLHFDPQDPARIYLSMWPGTAGPGLPSEPLSGGGVLLSEDGGETWKQVFDPTSYVFATEIDPDNPKRVFLVTFEGAAFHSEDGGKHWARIRGYDFKWGQRPTLDPSDSSKLYITTYGGGLWHGPAAGLTDAEAAEHPTWFLDRWRWTHPSIIPPF